MKLFAFSSWPDSDNARGWWFRLGRSGPGLHYRNISKGGYNPLFKERYGLDRAIAVRFGPHLFKLLRGR